MKNFTLSLFFCFAVSFCFGQLQQIYILDFETHPTSVTPNTYTTSPAEGDTDIQGKDNDYFKRTDEYGIEESNMTYEYSTLPAGDYFFTAQDIDSYNSSHGLPFTLTISNIPIAGYKNLEFRVYLSEDHDNNTSSWENQSGDNDYVHFDYSIDGHSVFEPLLWVEGNYLRDDDTLASIDNDLDGTGDGTTLNEDFVQFTEQIPHPNTPSGSTMPATGNIMDIIVEFSLNAGEEDIAIDNIEIWGEPDICPGGVATWDSSGWTGTPAIDTEVIISDHYDTHNNGSFLACNLTVTSGNMLTINNNGTVVVENDVIVENNASLIIESGSALVQHNDLGKVENNGEMKMYRETAPMDAWYEYTYWSSPVAGAILSTSIPFYNPNRLFNFDAENFKDALEEDQNDNSLVAGHDDVDDDGNDWILVSNPTIQMQPGIGYVTTTTPGYFNTHGTGNDTTLEATFTGTFNNGIIEVDIYRNDDEKGDKNWNLVGNPYPSALDSDQFFNGNPLLERAIYFWSQNSAPLSTLNGNEQQNFNQDDYAIINDTGNTDTGGDSNSAVRLDPTVNRFALPSGQSFFVIMKDGASTGINSAKVQFNNSMRTSYVAANRVFFKQNNDSKTEAIQPNKLWLNLTSTDNTFKQLLVGYVDGATNADDGVSYDADTSPTNGASLYSIVPGVDKKFTIQGKAPSSLTANEVIPLGFKTTLTSNILYTISLNRTEGDFFTNHKVILLDKENTPATRWDIFNTDYSFTSPIGEFNERFEIIFEDSTLSTEDLDTILKIQMITHDKNQVQFKTNGITNIKNISIFNLLGQELYQLKDVGTDKIYSLPNLSPIFIAEIEFDNGTVVVKKGIS
ncbi:hypothetical protein Q4566_06660 [Tamlana sp. 2_MG-2023]|uniref:hypothetical protein n=1 Tax=unclassified Tamlana TaxID=2614803 RepID=UPI0026E3C197|nr:MULTISPECIES: hypothetical protein [unclassified Tamlana]MDO6759877.1 hypothetical protein [Tamlana sp. 2_MG-2023]MDO6791953.1 hypothetical protein [Tamlana sp. 1_MG-2023]